MKQKTIYSCQNCGAQTPKWMGKCSECNQWNTLVEETFQDAPAATEKSAKGHAVFRAMLQENTEQPTGEPLRLNEIKEDASLRVATHFQELDRVLGGGLVP